MIQKKICMVGSFAVGKTSLVNRFVKSIFSEKYLTTVGVKIDKKTVDVDGRTVNLMLWDLYGEDEFQKLQMSYLRGSSGYFLVVDGTRKETLDKAMALRKRVAAAVGPVPHLMLFNKADLSEQWEIDLPALKKHLKGAIPVGVTSAKTGQGVEAAFLDLARRMLNVTER